MWLSERGQIRPPLRFSVRFVWKAGRFSVTRVRKCETSPDCFRLSSRAPLHIGTHFKALGGREAHVLSCEVKNVDPAFAVMPQVALDEPEQEASSGVN